MSAGSLTSPHPGARLTLVSAHLSDATTPNKPKVVVCRHLGPAMPQLERRTDIDLVCWPEDRFCDRAWLLHNVKGATGVIVLLGDAVNEEFMAAAGQQLKVVSTMSVGYEHIDLQATARHGVRVGYTPDVLTEAGKPSDVLAITSQLCWGNLAWSPFKLCGPQLSTTLSSPKRTVGFLGFGRIAQATLARLVGFGITHALYTGSPSSNAQSVSARDAELQTRYRLQGLERVDADRLAQESDVVFVLTPGGKETYHLVGEAFLRKMKPLSILVNTSRGSVVDSDALAKALHEKWIWGAGLDVVEGEPFIGGDHPLVKEPRCVILPHVGSATTETRLDMATRAIDNVIGGIFGGEMPSELK
ncbi:hypothetical protein HMN09_00168500 [Mycena chlorophos]|uniref:Glyoxylate reductase n=1 Tax=Mycena chlorophos TaxID=658473 RepID=A0A8H6TNG6_MYCCL|nr:hypothetical protein HMN09_00168500 [Mycena chlorophos]